MFCKIVTDLEMLVQSKVQSTVQSRSPRSSFYTYPYTSDGPFQHHALCRLLMDSIQQLHIHGFETVAVVCDGAASNLTMIKEMSGAPRKAYG